MCAGHFGLRIESQYLAYHKFLEIVFDESKIFSKTSPPTEARFSLPEGRHQKKKDGLPPKKTPQITIWHILNHDIAMGIGLASARLLRIFWRRARRREELGDGEGAGGLSRQLARFVHWSSMLHSACDQECRTCDLRKEFYLITSRLHFKHSTWPQHMAQQRIAVSLQRPMSARSCPDARAR